jgi:hypothetical protein
MYKSEKFEFNIAKRILNYDLKNIDKEIENLSIANKKREYCGDRLEQLFVLRENKIKQIDELMRKYERG